MFSTIFPFSGTWRSQFSHSFFFFCDRSCDSTVSWLSLLLFFLLMSSSLPELLSCFHIIFDCTAKKQKQTKKKELIYSSLFPVKQAFISVLPTVLFRKQPRNVEEGHLYFRLPPGFFPRWNRWYVLSQNNTSPLLFLSPCLFSFFLASKSKAQRCQK